VRRTETSVCDRWGRLAAVVGGPVHGNEHLPSVKIEKPLRGVEYAAMPMPDVSAAIAGGRADGRSLTSA
jgi:hypothetical protein